MKRVLTAGMRRLEQEPAETDSRISSQESYKWQEGCGRKVTHQSVMTGLRSRKESFSQQLGRVAD